MTIRILCPVLLALAGLSGCDDPVPPTAQGAVSFKMSSQPNGAACPEGSSPPRVSIGSVSTNTASPLINEESGAIVKCTVRESGGLYTVSGQIQDAEGNSFSFQTEAPAAGPSLAVAASMSSPNRINSLSSSASEPCTLDVQPTEDGSTNYGIAPGRVWGTISCPSLGRLNAPDNAAKCALGVPNGEKSYVLFENCDT